MKTKHIDSGYMKKDYKPFIMLMLLIIVTFVKTVSGQGVAEVKEAADPSMYSFNTQKRSIKSTILSFANASLGMGFDRDPFKQIVSPQNISKTIVTEIVKEATAEGFLPKDTAFVFENPKFEKAIEIAKGSETWKIIIL